MSTVAIIAAGYAVLVGLLLLFMYGVGRSDAEVHGL